MDARSLGTTPAMKKILFVLAATMALPIVSAAANEDVPPGFSWTGAYIGLQAGYAWGDSHYIEPQFPSFDAYYDPKGLLGGIYAGYNFQFDNRLVLGIDADVFFASINGDSPYYIDGVPASITSGESRLAWSGAARARFGYAFDRFLPYVAGGVALARYEYDMWDTVNMDGFETSKTRTGWTIGGGGEYAVTDNIILRGEYRYSDFGSERVDTADTVSWYRNDVDLKTHDLRIGVAYKF